MPPAILGRQAGVGTRGDRLCVKSHRTATDTQRSKPLTAELGGHLLRVQLDEEGVQEVVVVHGLFSERVLCRAAERGSVSGGPWQRLTYGRNPALRNPNPITECYRWRRPGASLRTHRRMMTGQCTRVLGV